MTSRPSQKVRVLSALAVAALVAVAASAYGRSEPERAAPLADSNAHATIEVPEVGCATCSVAVRRAVKAPGGVVGLAEGEPKNRLVVTFEPGAGRPGAYVESLRSAGFPKAALVE